MSVRLVEEVIHLEGPCYVEEAETLLAHLQSQPGRPVDVSACQHLHGAVVQVLLALRPPIRGRCEDAFLRSWVLPALIASPRTNLDDDAPAAGTPGIGRSRERE